MHKHKIILHADMDAFFASVEQQARNLQGFPVVVGSAPDKRGVVSAASYEARVFGIRSAMSSQEAYRRCPQAIFLPVNMELYRHVSKQVMQVFTEFTPIIEQISIDEAFLDVTGVMRNYESATEIASNIRSRIHQVCGITASIGIAPNKFLAKLASDMNKPNGSTLVPFDPPQIIEFLKPIPVASIWGVGKKMQPLLTRAGIRTVSDLQVVSVERLGQVIKSKVAAESLKALAFGQDQREVNENSYAEKSISNETTFSEDCADYQYQRSTLLALVDKVASRVRAAGLTGKVIKVKVRLSDFTTISRQATLSEVTDITDLMRRTALELFDKIEVKQSLRLIGFGVTKFSEPSKQQNLFSFDETPKLEKSSNLDQAIDRIRQQLGSDKLKRGF